MATQARETFAEIDADGEGEVSRLEFIQWYRREWATHARHKKKMKAASAQQQPTSRAAKTADVVVKINGLARQVSGVRWHNSIVLEETDPERGAEPSSRPADVEMTQI